MEGASLDKPEQGTEREVDSTIVASPDEPSDSEDVKSPSSLHNKIATSKVEEEEACAGAPEGEGKMCATKEDFSGIQLVTKRSQLEVRDGPTNEQEEPEKSTETGALMLNSNVTNVL